MDGQVPAGEFGRHAIDQEGHVVVHHLDHRVVGRPAVFLQRRVIDLNDGPTGFSGQSQFHVGDGRAEQGFRIDPRWRSRWGTRLKYRSRKDSASFLTSPFKRAPDSSLTLATNSAVDDAGRYCSWNISDVSMLLFLMGLFPSDDRGG